MKKLYISEEQKKHLQKAIAAQDQVGGKANAGIMGAVTGMVCEAHGDDIQTWYRGYNADLPNLGVPNGGGLWLTDEYDYAKQYADHFDNGKVAAVTIDFTKINWATETEIYDSDLDPYESGPMMAKAVRKLGFNAWICDYYDDNAQGLCLLDMSAVVSVEDYNDEMISEGVDDGQYKLGFEKGGFEPNGHILNETPDSVYNFDAGWRDDDCIAFLYSKKDDDLLVGRGTTHHRLIIDDGGSPDDDENYGDTEMRGRYWSDRNLISFWQTPSPVKLRFVVERLKKHFYTLNIDTKTLIVDVWDWGGFDWEVPYQWFFDGFLDDFSDKILRINLEDEEKFTFRVEFKQGGVYYCGLDGVLKPQQSEYAAVVESRKKIIKNDEGKVVPEKCDKCGEDVVLQIHGEPVYVCKKCGKYFGTMPFHKNLNENHEWCDNFEYTPYLKSIAKFLQENGINVTPFPRVKIHNEEQEGLYIKTGFYDPDERKVHLFIKDRHPKDVLRSFTHEMIHHSQNLRGELVGYKGETLQGDNILQKLESEAYLKGNIYFRKWTEELRPEIPTGTVKKKTRLNESIQDIYNMQEDWDEFGVSSLLSEFFRDKKRGIAKKQWDLIPAQQYQNLLTRYMQDPITARIPDNIVYDWFEKVVKNAFDIEYITELAGHSQWFPADEVQEEFDAWVGEKYQITDYMSGYEALEAEGFYEWCSLPDGSDGWSDYGLEPIFNELSYYKPNMPAGDLLILINRVLHIGHCRGDLASAFIEGGSQSCSAISGIIRESFDMGEITNPEDVDLSSFEVKDELNPKFWKDDRIDSRIRIALLDIADDFIETLDVDWVKPTDIIVTGSLANFNWSSEHSDIDLHIVMDYTEVDDNIALVKDYFDSKRRLWNEEHGNITIAGFPVELYVQDIDEPHASSGVYSLEKDKWLVKPDVNNFDTDYDESVVKHKVSEYMNEIDDLYEEYEDSLADCDLSELHKKAVVLFKKIKDERKNGFENGGGEYNVGNLIFKSLRRNGYIEKLDKIKVESYDSLKSIYNENKVSQ